MLLSVSLLTPNGSAVQASEQDCLSTSGALALEACQKALDQGNDSIDVYLKLIRSSNSLGEYDLALDTIDTAKLKYPRDKPLLELDKLVNSNKQELDYINSRKNKSPDTGVNNAKLKILEISCLRKSGTLAINACNDYISAKPNNIPVLERRADLFFNNEEYQASKNDYEKLISLTGDSKYRVQYQLALQKIAETNPVATVEVDETPPKTTAEVATIKSTPSLEPAPLSKTNDVENQRKRDTVRQIQSLLTQLGFHPGYADGIAGKNTVDKLQEFYAYKEGSAPQELDQNLVRILEDALNNQKTAEASLPNIDSSISAEKYQEAINTTETSLLTAPWSALLSEKLVIVKSLKTERESQQTAKRQKALAETLAEIRFHLRNENPGKAEQIATASLEVHSGNLELEKLALQAKDANMTSQVTDIENDVKVFYKNHRYADANELIRSGLKTYPENPALIAMLSETDQRLSSFNDAQQKKKEDLAVLESKSSELIQRGNALLSSVIDVDSGRILAFDSYRALLQRSIPENLPSEN